MSADPTLRFTPRELIEALASPHAPDRQARLEHLRRSPDALALVVDDPRYLAWLDEATRDGQTHPSLDLLMTLQRTDHAELLPAARVTFLVEHRRGCGLCSARAAELNLHRADDDPVPAIALDAPAWVDGLVGELLPLAESAPSIAAWLVALGHWSGSRSTPAPAEYTRPIGNATEVRTVLAAVKPPEDTEPVADTILLAAAGLREEAAARLGDRHKAGGVEWTIAAALGIPVPLPKTAQPTVPSLGERLRAWLRGPSGWVLGAALTVALVLVVVRPRTPGTDGPKPPPGSATEPHTTEPPLVGAWIPTEATHRGDGDSPWAGALAAEDRQAMLASFLLGATQGIVEVARARPNAKQLHKAGEVQLELMGESMVSKSAVRTGRLGARFGQKIGNSTHLKAWFDLGRAATLRALGGQVDVGPNWQAAGAAQHPCIIDAGVQEPGCTSSESCAALVRKIDGCFGALFPRKKTGSP